MKQEKQALRKLTEIWAFSCCLAMGLNLGAATWIVDRDPANESANFSSLDEAIEASSESDIIYLMPSGTAYGLETINKSITIIGSGYGKGYRFPNAPSEDSRIDFFTIHADNVFLTGLVFEGGVSIKTPAKGITFYRNYFTGNSSSAAKSFRATTIEGSPDSPVSDLHLINNWFDRTRINFQTECINLKFLNNVINRGYMLLHSGSGDFINNYIAVLQEGPWSYQKTGLSIPLRGRFYNNILFNQHGGINVESDLIANNLVDITLTSASEFPENTNPRFTELDSITTRIGSFGDELKLIENSPAIGAGLNGDDIGIFGGLHPWDDDLQPPLPIITYLEAPSVVGAGQGFEVSIEVKSNH